MSITWQGVPEKYRAGLARVAALQPDVDLAATVKVAKQATPGLTVERDGADGMITYDSPSDLMRAVTLWLGHARGQGAFTLTEQAHYQTVGVMIDVARNAVPKVQTLKDTFVRLASLGYTEVWLYMEDCFEIPEEPYFGHQRGRYSQADLHELALAADAVGLTLVPAIQTLAHLRNLFKWRAFDDVMDAPDCLYVQKPETTVFLRNLLRAASAPFLTKKIHIGMDEAYNLGRGQLLRDRGLIPQEDLMVAHLKTVVGLCDELGLHPAMWSDMWFKMASQQHRLYDPDTEFSKELVASIPPVAQVYWDYYHDQEAPYDRMFELHAKLHQRVIFASGIWTWNGLAPTMKTMQVTLRAGMAAAAKAGIQDVVTTMWGDDGSEVPLRAAWLGLQTFAEYQYHDVVSDAWAASQFALMQSRDEAAYMLLDKFENQLAEGANMTIDDPGKILLYEDLLLQRYRQNLAGFDYASYYAQLATALAAATVTPADAPMFTYYAHLAHLLSVKATALGELQTLLERGTAALPRVTAALNDLKAALVVTVAEFRQLWHAERRGQGFEIMDLRLNGLIGRVDTTLWRLAAWGRGEDALEELQAPVLEMDKYTSGPTGRGRYIQIISACGISQNM
ncbi:beta-N-acetylhexosaminidase [Lacticaseibacillus parakribbianus]|uniref:beta-N-acetylhexosaminidase n=1 Tax=Lacticaseibacillus parakribbianus TaxID=2970927 RepID=UPI0021CAED39|nr:beta-N-acetylhexosaminidase [Lacticaseibacillus parakribbianus]